MISAKSQKFVDWIVKMYDRVGCPNEVIELELAARLAVHDLDTMGEITEKSLRALARASKQLEAEYVNDESG